MEVEGFLDMDWKSIILIGHMHIEKYDIKDL